MKRYAGSICLIGVIAAIFLVACTPRHHHTGRRVVVLGVDGLDYELVSRLMTAGRMPNFERLAQSGSFAPLATTIPPQSPVAWSTFMTGLDPGGHGIFDFIHRDPVTLVPFLSTTRTESGRHNVVLGRWQFPLQAGRIDQLRRGEPFWQFLERRGIETTVVRMPANFPPSGAATREIGGMGTPDILGTYGTFSYFTSDPSAFEGKTVSGGVIVPVHVVNGTVRGAIDGPANPYFVAPQKTTVDFSAFVDRDQRHIKLAVGTEERLVGVGEWTDWVPVELGLLPFQAIRGEVRFFLKSIAPAFQLYVSPINVDPLNPALPVSSPGDYASEIARANGRFYTQGMPHDTKGLRSGVLSNDEFLEQAGLIQDETRTQYRYVLDRFTDGLLFYYFGHVDQISHMMWRAMDPGHPAHTPSDDPYRGLVEKLYEGIDDLVGDTQSRLGPDDLLVVMSDHGFASWRRSFSLNSWLRDNGYLAVRDPNLAVDPGFFGNIDWAHTRAYGLGLNGLYVNVRGREALGIVRDSERGALAAEIGGKLLQIVDPTTGSPAITKAFRREDVYRLHDDEQIAPDLIVGYAKGTRVSDDSALGAIPREVMIDNLDAWGADHCMDPEAVPGILLTSRPLKKPAPSLQTLAAAIVAEFGIDGFPRRPEDP